MAGEGEDKPLFDGASSGQRCSDWTTKDSQASLGELSSSGRQR